MLTDSKKPWQSKTILLNAIVGLAGFVALFIPGAEGVKIFVDSNAVMIGTIWSVLNVLLRAVSKNAISLVD